MPWKEQTTMSQRQRFVEQASQEGANISQVCRELGISRKTGYKWLKRFHEAGMAGLVEPSRRPHHSPTQTRPEVEALILRARAKHPAWGARKLKAWLEQRGFTDLPAASTITAILQRHGRLDPLEALKHRPYQRFERPTPNQLWQMDFKGDVRLQDGKRCYPLSVLDDCSRFLLTLPACSEKTHDTVQAHLLQVFDHYGLPEAMLMDNGSPWGDEADQPHTFFTVWLMRLGIRVIHGRPYHPQTQGKVERLHRALDDELLRHRLFVDRQHCHWHLSEWRDQYNLERPHEALNNRPPATCYTPSGIDLPAQLPPVEYPTGAWVGRVQQNGVISFRGRVCRVGKAFRGLPVALQPDPLTDGLFAVYFLNTRIAILDFNRNHYRLS